MARARGDLRAPRLPTGRRGAGRFGAPEAKHLISAPKGTVM
ncbi:hypothetical protein EPIB1_992 [Tritonibacter mobilis]|nr:hypothetical protein EPIB1_992 [Tritonibacter mobilis]